MFNFATFNFWRTFFNMFLNIKFSAFFPFSGHDDHDCEKTTSSLVFLRNGAVKTLADVWSSAPLCFGWYSLSGPSCLLINSPHSMALAGMKTMWSSSSDAQKPPQLPAIGREAKDADGEQLSNFRSGFSSEASSHLRRGRGVVRLPLRRWSPKSDKVCFRFSSDAKKPCSCGIWCHSDT